MLNFLYIYLHILLGDGVHATLQIWSLYDYHIYHACFTTQELVLWDFSSDNFTFWTIPQAQQFFYMKKCQLSVYIIIFYKK